MLWIALSFLASFSRAASRLSNQYFKLPGLHLVLWIKLFITFLLLPVVLFISWPTEPLFYVFLLLQAPLVVFQDKKTFDLTATHGGGVVTRIEPLSAVLLFIVWLLITPSLLQENLESPIRFLFIAVTIALMAFFTMRMRKCEINVTVLKEMLPIILTTTCVSVLGKLSIDHAEFDSGVFVYVFVQSVVMFVWAIVFNIKDKSVELSTFFNKRNAFCAFFLSIVMMITVLSRVYAFRYVDNPAYVNAIVLTAPFWIILFYKFVKHEEKGDVLSGVGLVCCAIVLTFIVIQ